MIAQPRFVLFAPLSGGDERELLGIPAREHDAAFRLPPSLAEFSECLRELHECGRPRRRIDATVDPRVAMIADDNDFALGATAPDHPGHGPDRSDVFGETDFHPDDCRAWTGPEIPHQIASKPVRDRGTSKRLQDRARVSG